MMWGYGTFMWGYGLLMMLGMLLWIVLVVVLAWAAIRWLSGRNTPPTRDERSMPSDERSALEILQQRYARGEIDATTFEQMRERLEASMEREHLPTR